MTTKKVLIIGAGRVAGPCIQFLLDRQYDVTVGSVVQDELEAIHSAHPLATTCVMNVENTEALRDLVKAHDVTVGLVPSHLLPPIAELCIQQGKHFSSASYVSEDMQKLNDKAVTAGVTLLTEMGLDPGIDHALSMSVIDAIKARNGQVTLYKSLCGGLPAPEHSHCLLRYKFSWFPEGMLTSTMNSAQYLMDGQTVNIASGEIFNNVTILDDLLESEKIESIPNRDSVHYKDVYNIPSAHTVFRGTLRYQGFSKVMKTMIKLGLLIDDTNKEGKQYQTWRGLMCGLLGIADGSSDESLRQCLFSVADNDWQVVDTLVQLGLCEETPLPDSGSLRGDLASLLSSRLAYGPNEVDMVLMRTVIEASYPDGKRERHTLDMLDKGVVNGYSAMSRTVGITVGLGVHLLCQGKVEHTGVILPDTPDIYTPLLETLAEENIHIKLSIKEIN